MDSVVVEQRWKRHWVERVFWDRSGVQVGHIKSEMTPRNTSPEMELGILVY